MRGDRAQEGDVEFYVASDEGEDGAGRSVSKGGLSSDVLGADILGCWSSHEFVCDPVDRDQS